MFSDQVRLQGVCGRCGKPTDAVLACSTPDDESRGYVKARCCLAFMCPCGFLGVSEAGAKWIGADSSEDVVVEERMDLGLELN